MVTRVLPTRPAGRRPARLADLGAGVHHQRAHQGDALVQHADLAGQGKQSDQGGQDGDPQQHVRNHQGFGHDQFLS
jgi:hypothetical protein